VIRRPLALLLVVSTVLPACRCERAEDYESAPEPATSPSTTTSVEATPLLDTIEDLRRRGKAEYQAPSPEERQAYGAWVGAIAGAAWTDRLPSELPPAGFSGRLGAGGTLWLLQELPRRKRGAGVVIVRPSRGAPLLVEAPHTFFDEGTLEIALATFHGIRARALLVNTMHRYATVRQGVRTSPDVPQDAASDVAHDPNTFFGAAHEALLAVKPLTTLQIHGFADDTAPGVMVVVSAARTIGDAPAVARALRDALGDDVVRVYPEEIDVLGGTSNVLAKVSRELGLPFLHLELSRSLRDTLRHDPAAMERFVAALRVLEAKRGE